METPRLETKPRRPHQRQKLRNACRARNRDRCWQLRRAGDGVFVLNLRVLDRSRPPSFPETPCPLRRRRGGEEVLVLEARCFETLCRSRRRFDYGRPPPCPGRGKRRSVSISPAPAVPSIQQIGRVGTEDTPAESLREPEPSQKIPRGALTLTE